MGYPYFVKLKALRCYLEGLCGRKVEQLSAHKARFGNKLVKKAAKQLKEVQKGI